MILETTKLAKYSKRALCAGLPAWREKPEGYAPEHNVLEKTQNDTEKSTACGCGYATVLGLPIIRERMFKTYFLSLRHLFRNRWYHRV